MSQQNQTKPRKWLIEGEPIVIDGYEHDVLRDTLDECVMMLRRVGGAVCVKTPGGTLILGSIRERLGIELDPTGEFYETTGFIAQWVPSLPSARRVEPAPEPEDEPDPEPDPPEPVLEAA
jgi:hypothetical protein